MIDIDADMISRKVSFNDFTDINPNSFNGLLISFGCSWTYGVGVNYEQGMSEDELKANAWNDTYLDTHTFRALLSKKFNLFNLNFAEGGSSNQKQFRYANVFFDSPYFNKIKHQWDKIIIIWGITSTARTEHWDTDINDYNNYQYAEFLSTFNKMRMIKTYNHDVEVSRLSENMNIMNGFMAYNKIKNLWFDTFNTHEYNQSIYNLIDGDLLSLIGGAKQSDNEYHESFWNNDDKRLPTAVDSGILNPYSFHPTKLGHQKIAEILEPRIKQMVV